MSDNKNNTSKESSKEENFQKDDDSNIKDQNKNHNQDIKAEDKVQNGEKLISAQPGNEDKAENKEREESKKPSDNNKDDGKKAKTAEKKQSQKSLDEKNSADKKEQPSKDTQTLNKEPSKQERDDKTSQADKDTQTLKKETSKEAEDKTFQADKDISENVKEEKNKKDMQLTSEEKKELEEKDRKKEEKKKKTAQKKEKFKKFIKKNKLWVILASIILVLAIGVTTTILVLNAPKVFVRDSEDFTQQLSSRKDVFVLKDDITIENLDLTSDMNIDLNKKSLTVTDTLTISLGSNKEGAMDIGTIQGLFKNKGFGSGGKLVAENIQVELNNKTLVFHSQSELSGEIIAKELVIKEKMDIVQNLSLINSQIKIYANVAGNINLTNSNLFLEKNTDIDTISADSFSNAEIYGNIVEKLSGGNEISILQNAKCAEVANVKELYFQQQTAEIQNATGIENLHIVTQLEKPAELIVEKTGSSFKCIASKVLNADEYIFTIATDEDGILATIPSSSNEADISKYLTKPTEYQISVKAASNTPRINLTSEERKIEYSYSAKLENPALSLDLTQDDEVMLTFPAVNFATVYKVDINGEKTSIEGSGQQISFNISDYVAQPKAYAIKVQATNPDNKSFTSSDVVMISYIKTIKLETPALEISKENQQITMSWNKITNAKYYIIENDKNDKKIMTSNLSYSISAQSVEDNTTFYLYAKETGYYESSDASSAKYEYQSLQSPDQPQLSLDSNTLTISTQTVENAESYALFKNNSEIISSDTPVFEIDTFESGDSFKIEARAEGYRPSQSEAVSYDA